MLPRKRRVGISNRELQYTAIEEGHMNPKQSGRRRFLKEGPVLAAGLAAGVIGIPSASGQTPEAVPPERSSASRNAYGQRSRFENYSQRRLADHQTRDYGFRNPMQDQLGIITP